MKRIAVLVSGGGTNLQALIDAQDKGQIPHGKIVLVVASKGDAYAISRAKKAGISAKVITRASFPTGEDFDETLLELLYGHGIDLIVLAGYTRVLGPRVVKAFPNRILNVHPSLIPQFCGDGYYGLKVHEAALEYGVKVTGATVHYVNEKVDGGPILLQEPVMVQPDDTPKTLQQRVMEEAEWKILPKAVEMVCAGDEQSRKGRPHLGTER